jgi:hypothetical protein
MCQGRARNLDVDRHNCGLSPQGEDQSVSRLVDGVTEDEEWSV